MKLQSGHEAVPLEGDELKKQLQNWKGYEDGLVRLTPGRWLLPHRYIHFADKLYSFKVRQSDVIVMSYPKCGTTWTQEIVWTILNNPDLNHPDALKSIHTRSPSVYGDIITPTPKPGDSVPKNPILDQVLKKYPIKVPTDGGISLLLTDAFQDPRTIKTHLPLSLNPPSLLDTSKVVYVVRNPKDVIVSFYHQCRIVKLYGYVGNFEDFVQYFVDDDVLYGPYWLHVKEAWDKRNHPNIHIIFYEDLKENPLHEIKKLNTFLDTHLTEKQLEGIVKYTSFVEMKSRDAKSASKMGETNLFKTDLVKEEGGLYRKGESGDWKSKLTPDLEVKVDQWIQKNFTIFGIDFKYGF